MQVTLEAFSGRELPQNIFLLFHLKAMTDAAFLECILQPQAFFAGRHVRKLGTDTTAVGLLQLADDVAQLHARRHCRRAAAGKEAFVEVRFT